MSKLGALRKPGCAIGRAKSSARLGRVRDITERKAAGLASSGQTRLFLTLLVQLPFTPAL